jgi:hypothetical protein
MICLNELSARRSILAGNGFVGCAQTLALDRQPVDIRVVVFPLINWK